jgi:ABC-type branched-subunit amino acid transport system ATPase component
MLTVRDLTVRYGRTPAVENISLEVGEGEIVGLVGPNGAGKSTTLAAILGLVPVAAGRITYLGESLVGLAPATPFKAAGRSRPTARAGSRTSISIISAPDRLTRFLARVRRSRP